MRTQPVSLIRRRSSSFGCISWIAALVLITAHAAGFAVPGGAEIDDADITRAVRTNLQTDKGVSAHLIDVSTHDGVVVLKGTVDNILAEQRSLRIAQAVKGVRSVVNEIDVNPVTRSDEKIRADVLSALAVDPATESYDVMVTVDDGVVGLSGTVDSWAERNLAEKVAKGIRGVHAIDNTITVEYDEERPDLEIQKEIERKLALNPHIEEQWIDVSVKEGNVELNGAVGTVAQRSLVYNESWVLGTESVSADDVEIKWWARDEMVRDDNLVVKTDSALEQAVKDALLWDPRTLSFEIGVEAEKGTVTLTGVVDNLKTKRAAGRDARNTVGVDEVRNYIMVRPYEPADNVIEENVDDALGWDPVVERHEIDPVVRNKKVYLYGNVDNHYEKAHAEDVVAGVNGVAEVSNNLTVNGKWQWKSDREITSDVENELYWSWVVDESAIDVTVDEGVATLKGDVGSWQERRAAVEEAFAGGAKVVVSRLDVEGIAYDEKPIYFTDESTAFSSPVLIPQ
ncbi:MAG: BON domain-containing protein [Chitinivibrionales bacterium]|nr:BON domain-containing protein [Chitinivibrionales bacterium]MBD3356711.1 BON domain-containing protein [Chitinivibrionales bacterium]